MKANCMLKKFLCGQLSVSLIISSRNDEEAKDHHTVTPRWDVAKLGATLTSIQTTISTFCFPKSL